LSKPFLQINDPYWCIYRRKEEQTTLPLDWYAGLSDAYSEWQSDWRKRLRFGSFTAVMAMLWDLRGRFEDTLKVVKVTQRQKAEVFDTELPWDDLPIPEEPMKP